MINSGTMEGYASARTKSHLLRFQRLCQQVKDGTIDEAWLGTIEAQDNVFPGIDVLQDFRAPHRPPGSTVQAPCARVEPRPRSSPIHVVMICPEIVPLAKTGGLADMAGSLAVTLEELGLRVSVILPAYRQVFEQGPRIQGHRNPGFRRAWGEGRKKRRCSPA